MAENKQFKYGFDKANKEKDYKYAQIMNEWANRYGINDDYDNVY